MRTAIAPFGAITVFRTVQAVERLVGGVRAAWTAHATQRQLDRLSPEQLADIGLADRSRSRADLDEVARRLAYRA